MGVGTRQGIGLQKNINVPDGEAESCVREQTAQNSPKRGCVDNKGLSPIWGRRQSSCRRRRASRGAGGFEVAARSGQGSQRSGTIKPGNDSLIQAASSAGGTGSPCQSIKAAGLCPHLARHRHHQGPGPGRGGPTSRCSMASGWMFPRPRDEEVVEPPLHHQLALGGEASLSRVWNQPASSSGRKPARPPGNSRKRGVAAHADLPWRMQISRPGSGRPTTPAAAGLAGTDLAAHLREAIAHLGHQPHGGQPAHQGSGWRRRRAAVRAPGARWLEPRRQQPPELGRHQGRGG